MPFVVPRPKHLKYGDLLSLAGLLFSVVFSVATMYRAYLYVRQQLNVNVTHVFFSTGDHDLSMCVAFANTGNKASAIVRVNPIIWSGGHWVLVSKILDGYGTLTTPDTPIAIKAGEVNIISLEASVEAKELVDAAEDGRTVVGISLQTMNSDGTLFTSRYPVVRFTIRDGAVIDAEALIDASRNAFADFDDKPKIDVDRAKLRMPGTPLVGAW